MPSFFDYDRLEAAEAVAHLKQVVACGTRTMTESSNSLNTCDAEFLDAVELDLDDFVDNYDMVDHAASCHEERIFKTRLRHRGHWHRRCHRYPSTPGKEEMDDSSSNTSICDPQRSGGSMSSTARSHTKLTVANKVCCEQGNGLFSWCALVAAMVKQNNLTGMHIIRFSNKAMRYMRSNIGFSEEPERKCRQKPLRETETVLPPVTSCTARPHRFSVKRETSEDEVHALLLSTRSKAAIKPAERADSRTAEVILSQDSLARWQNILKVILRSGTAMCSPLRLSRRQISSRKLLATAADIRRWRYLNGESLRNRSDAHRTLLCNGVPPNELTLCHQAASMEAVQARRDDKRIRSRWNRVCLSLCDSHLRRCRREALREARPEISGQGVVQQDTWQDHRSFAFDEDELMAAQCGLDIATYLMLRQLQEREIMPEDYDLLGRLDESVAPTTLSSEELLHFDVLTYSSVEGTCSCGNVSSTNAGAQSSLASQWSFDFWRLPLRKVEEDIEPLKETCTTEFGIDFWKLPLLPDDEEVDFSYHSANSCCSFQSVCCDDSTRDGSSQGYSQVCGVCLIDFENGNELRKLPCGHLFHRECIDHWLLHSSTVCPVDKRDCRRS